MAQNKNQVAKQLGVGTAQSNQEALVKRLIQKVIKPVKFVIPSGKTMTEQLDEKGLQSACYTWLRHCAGFTEVTVSLARDPNSVKGTRTRKLEDFPVGATPAWENQNRRWLAERIGTALFETPGVVALNIKPDGMYVTQDLTNTFSPNSDEWEPYVEFMPKAKESFRGV